MGFPSRSLSLQWFKTDLRRRGAENAKESDLRRVALRPERSKHLEPGRKMRRLFGVKRGRRAKSRPLAIGKLPNYPRRASHDQASALEALSFGNQCARPDQAFGFEHCAVQDPRAHSDQAIVGDRTAMEDRLMAYRDPGADRQWHSRVGMADRAVLEIRVVAKDQRRIVPAEDRAEPDARPRAQPHVADEIGWWGGAG